MDRTIELLLLGVISLAVVVQIASMFLMFKIVLKKG